MRSACFISDPTSLKLYDDIGIDIIAFETDYPHSDSLWPDAPEVLLEQCDGAGLSDDADRPGQLAERGAVLRLRPVRRDSRERRRPWARLRAQAADVDTSTVSRSEWRRRYEANPTYEIARPS